VQQRDIPQVRVGRVNWLCGHIDDSAVSEHQQTAIQVRIAGLGQIEMRSPQRVAVVLKWATPPAGVAQGLDDRQDAGLDHRNRKRVAVEFLPGGISGPCATAADSAERAGLLYLARQRRA